MRRHVVTCDRCKQEDDGNHQRSVDRVAIPMPARQITNEVDLCLECREQLEWKLEDFMKPPPKAG